MEARIIAIDDGPIAEMSDAVSMPTGEIGEICVRGPVVTHAYFRRADATRLAKMRDGDTIWHRMGDVGYLDEQGRIWFCGRKAHRVTTAKETLFTICCEAIFNRHPKVLRTALVGIGPAGQQQPVLCVQPEAGVPSSAHPAIESALRTLATERPLTREIDRFLFHPAFPVDVRHNAKIFREKLAVWAAEQAK
jgi:acyl-CoA synthetase (AMP-forming)/AMP-acid ligase II